MPVGTRYEVLLYLNDNGDYEVKNVELSHINYNLSAPVTHSFNVVSAEAWSSGQGDPSISVNLNDPANRDLAEYLVTAPDGNPWYVDGAGFSGPVAESGQGYNTSQFSISWTNFDARTSMDAGLSFTISQTDNGQPSFNHTEVERYTDGAKVTFYREFADDIYLAFGAASVNAINGVANPFAGT